MSSRRERTFMDHTPFLTGQLYRICSCQLIDR